MYCQISLKMFQKFISGEANVGQFWFHLTRSKWFDFKFHSTQTIFIVSYLHIQSSCDHHNTPTWPQILKYSGVVTFNGIPSAQIWCTRRYCSHCIWIYFYFIGFYCLSMIPPYPKKLSPSEFGCTVSVTRQCYITYTWQSALYAWCKRIKVCHFSNDTIENFMFCATHMIQMHTRHFLGRENMFMSVSPAAIVKLTIKCVPYALYHNMHHKIEIENLTEKSTALWHVSRNY